jgi:hypothetical protein
MVLSARSALSTVAHPQLGRAYLLALMRTQGDPSLADLTVGLEHDIAIAYHAVDHPLYRTDLACNLALVKSSDLPQLVDYVNRLGQDPEGVANQLRAGGYLLGILASEDHPGVDRDAERLRIIERAVDVLLSSVATDVEFDTALALLRLHAREQFMTLPATRQEEFLGLARQRKNVLLRAIDECRSQ